MDTGSIRSYNSPRASRITVLAHLFGVLAIILLLVWLLNYRGGIDYDSDNGFLVFNVHPLMMFLGFIFLAGEAMMAYRTLPGERKTQKTVHMIVHSIAIIFGVVGLCAVFKFHDMANVVDVYSLHSWIGIGTFCLFCLQWLFGFFTFFVSKSTDSTRLRMAPWHISGGRALLYMAIGAALTGLIEKYQFLGLQAHQGESHLVNFLGLSILLFGVFVDLSVSLAHFV